MKNGLEIWIDKQIGKSRCSGRGGSELIYKGVGKIRETKKEDNISGTEVF